MEKISKEIKEVFNVLNKLIENQKEFLIRVEERIAKKSYDYRDGRTFVNEEDYDKLYNIIVENHTRFAEILDGWKSLVIEGNKK